MNFGWAKLRHLLYVGALSTFFLQAKSPEINPFGCEIEAGSVLMIDVPTGRVLFSKDPHKKIHPASTTKIATALLVYQKLKDRLESPVEITRDMVGAISPAKKIASGYSLPAHWIETASTHMGLKVGEIMSVHDLLRGALIVSANDASNALALTASGSYSQFMQELNAYAKGLGCLNTHFLNAHGLYHPEHVSTVYDLAILGRVLLLEPDLANIVNTRSFKRPQTNKQEPALMHNTSLIRPPGKIYYSKACGVKVGYTIHSGGSLVAAAKDESRFVLVSLSDCASLSKCFEEARKLMEVALEEKRIEKIYFKAGAPLATKHKISGASQPIEAMVKDYVKLSFYPSEEVPFKGQIVWETLVPPVKKGQYVGRVEIIDPQEKVMASSILVAMNDVEPNLFFHMTHGAKKYPVPTVVLILGILFVCLLILRRR
jgi:D-alanyl-D-alanine carboxypeptidase (penicillin-binding protein 5/6)